METLSLFDIWIIVIKGWCVELILSHRYWLGADERHGG